MDILLDTHTFLWAAADAPSLSNRAKALYLDSANRLFLSMASVWEIAIKVSLKKLTLNMALSDLIEEARNDQGIVLQKIELDHVLLVQTLPFHHRDPFDRLLVAQAISQKRPILGNDTTMDLYGIERIW